MYKFNKKEVQEFIDNIKDFGFEREASEPEIIKLFENFPLPFRNTSGGGRQREFQNLISGWAYMRWFSHKKRRELVKLLNQYQRYNRGGDEVPAGSCHIHFFLKKRININNIILQKNYVNSYIWKKRNASRCSISTTPSGRGTTRIKSSTDIEFRLNERVPTLHNIAYHLSIFYISYKGYVFKELIYKNYENKNRGCIKINGVMENKILRKNYNQLKDLIKYIKSIIKYKVGKFCYSPNYIELLNKCNLKVIK